MKIRKCRKVINFECTEIVDLEPDNFRHLPENPYSGNTDKEFLDYIKNLTRYGEIPYDLGIEDEIALEKLGELAEWEVYSSSLEKGEESWLESGKENQAFYKTGGFEIENSTDN
jgi:hypothetical protein